MWARGSVFAEQGEATQKKGVEGVTKPQADRGGRCVREEGLRHLWLMRVFGVVPLIPVYRVVCLSRQRDSQRYTRLLST